MYSDKWLKDKSVHKATAIKINSTTSVQSWLNDDGQLVGVCVNFELADDVHYELEADKWIRFEKEILGIEPTDDFVEPFRKFLSSSLPQVDFAITLYNKGIEYEKLSFIDFED